MKKIASVIAISAGLAACGGGGGGLIGPPSQSVAGSIDSFEIRSSVDAYAGATPGNAAGPYTVITGVVHGKLNPNHPDNAGIVDLKLAPVDASGNVAYDTDVVILRPKTATTARRVMLYEVVNRGSKLNINRLVGGGALTDGAAPPANISSVLQRGYTMVWSGWQGNLPLTGAGATDSIGTTFPIAKNADGSAITGLSREEFVQDNAGGVANIPLKYPPASLTDRSEVVFTARQSWITPSSGLQDYAAPSVPVTDWSYVRNADNTVSVKFTAPAAVPTSRGTTEPADQGTIYSFVYRAKDPMVMGIGFAAVRDLVHFLQHGAADGKGVANPLNDLKSPACAAASCPDIRRANFDVVMAEGVSQSGRFLRDFVYQGFNKAQDGSKVFDGMLPIGTGARRIWLNHRFAQPDRASKQHEDRFSLSVDAPFTYAVRQDIFGGAPDGILKNCLATNTCPKILHLDGSMEWWTARGSLVVTDGAGKDLALPDNVRYYFIASEQHTGSSTGVTTGLTTQPLAGTRCEFAPNPVTQSPVERALIPRLERWVADGSAPPASTYPTVASGTATTPDRASIGFPDLSNILVPNGPTATPLALSVAYSGIYNQLAVTDYSRVVPTVDLGRTYKILLPKVNAIGNEVAGIQMPEVAVPVATYAGWNYRRAGFAQGDICALVGSTIPLAVSPATKAATDPRPTLAGLYAGRADYQRQFGAAADALVAQGFLTELDAASVYKAGAARISPLLIPAP